MGRDQQGFLWLVVGAVVAVVAAWLGMQFPREGKPALIGALDWTGRLAFFVFLVPLLASPLRTIVRNAVSLTLMRWRRNAGIVYGAVQSIHLLLILWMFEVMPDPPVLPGMTEIGALGLLLCLAMLVTSFSVPARALGPARWKLLHKAGMYVFAFIYFYEFVFVPASNGVWDHFMLPAALISAGLLLRTWVWLVPPHRSSAR